MAIGRRDPDGELRHRIERRVQELWQAAGRPEGRELEFRLQAEEELGQLSVAGEEDPQVALDQLGRGSLADEREP
jgi:hypothetical protein